MEIIEFFKETIERAEAAKKTITVAESDYKRNEALVKGMLEGDLLGQKGFDERIAELKQKKDAAVKISSDSILETINTFDIEMNQLDRLDGNDIDDATMKILNSGLTLKTTDWQALADQHKDNVTMTKILKQRYKENRPDDETHSNAVRFPLLPSEKKDIFKRFVYKVNESCIYNVISTPATGGHFKSATDYFNNLAKDSLSAMGYDDQDTLNKEFPVQLLNRDGKPLQKVDPAEQMFNFTFNPVRKKR